MYFRSIVPALALLAPALASNVLDLTPANFDAEVLNSGKPALVEFFAPWCGHCKNLAPVYEELADSFATSKKNVLIAKVDADEHKSLGSKFGVQGFPTIKFFDGKSKEPEDYTGGRDLESFQNYITEKTKVRAKRAAKAPSEIKHLTDKTFEKAIGGAKGVFVAFTAPWCGHCKTLAPVWETLASDLVGDRETVSIAKVDAEAEKKVADTYGIKSYPTIKYFPKGSTTPVDYTGGRSIGDLISYVNEQAGTHRVPGGGLDLTAGTVAALDKLVQGVSGKTLDSVVADVQKAAADAKDAGVAYYIKVLNKIKENSGYVQKESSRLEGILAKGGLSRSKQDDLTRRLNVLKKFVAQPEADTISENMEAIKESVKSVREEL